MGTWTTVDGGEAGPIPYYVPDEGEAVVGAFGGGPVGGPSQGTPAGVEYYTIPGTGFEGQGMEQGTRINGVELGDLMDSFSQDNSINVDGRPGGTILNRETGQREQAYFVPSIKNNGFATILPKSMALRLDPNSVPYQLFPDGGNGGGIGGFLNDNIVGLMLAAGAGGIASGALPGMSAASSAPGTLSGTALSDSIMSEMVGGGLGNSTAGTFGSGSLSGGGMDWFSPDNIISEMVGGGNSGAGALSDWFPSADNILEEMVGGAGGANPGGVFNSPGLWDTIKNSGSSALKSIFGNGALTGGSGGLFGGSGGKDLLSLAMLASLLEKNKSPLVDPMTNAARGALGTADVFSTLPSIPLMPSQARAIGVANAGAGNWRPYMDAASKDIPDVDLSRYMNPYIESALKPAEKAINRTATTRRMGNQAKAAQVGAFGGSRAAVEQGALDRGEMEAVGDLFSKGYSDAFDRATGLATTDLNRKQSIGRDVGSLTAGDFNMLQSAGALERQPFEDQRNKIADTAKLYTGVIHGTAPAVTASTPTSKLSQAVGALGAINALDKTGIV